MNTQIAFITYETPYAPGGGIAAVMAHLPKSIHKSSGLPTYVISPYHRYIAKTTDIEQNMEVICKIQVPFDDRIFDIEVRALDNEINWVFLKSTSDTNENPPFFSGQRHPYDVETTSNQSILLRDSLFFGKAVSSALPAINAKCHWVILLQDWEAATTTLALSNQPEVIGKTSQFLTLHNSYDCGVSDGDLRRIGISRDREVGHTILEYSLPLLGNPIFTVSKQFAEDLSTEILQTEIMIPHITSQLRTRLLGVNNGVFMENAIPHDIYSSAVEGDYSSLRDWKNENRKQAFAAIDSFSPAKSTPIWGDTKKFDRGEAQWFVMAGRDDSRQKGFELACLAAERYLHINDQARFLFFPIPGEEGLSGISFIKSLAQKYPHRVLAFPFLFREGFFPILRGATFGMMPSYYEPFGMANEYYLNGVVCIGRATGGITQQVVPFRQASSFSLAVKKRSDRWDRQHTPATGFLFREPDDIPNKLVDWQAINAANNAINSQKSNRLEQRRKLPTVHAMVEEFVTCLEDASQIFQTNQDLYYQMVTGGISYIQKEFSWNNAAKTYLKHILPD